MITKINDRLKYINYINRSHKYILICSKKIDNYNPFSILRLYVLRSLIQKNSHLVGSEESVLSIKVIS